MTIYWFAKQLLGLIGGRVQISRVSRLQLQFGDLFGRHDAIVCTSHIIYLRVYTYMQIHTIDIEILHMYIGTVMRFVSHHCDFCSETFVSPPRASRLWRGLWGEQLDPMGSSAMNPEVQLQHVFPWEKWTTKRTCWTYSLWAVRNEHNVQWSILVFYTVLIVFWFCGSVVSVEHRKNMFSFYIILRHPLDQELFVVDMMWTDKPHKQWHKCRTGSGRCHVCLHGKACFSATFVAGCGVVYPRLVPPSLGIYPWVIGCSSLWNDPIWLKQIQVEIAN